MNKLLLILLALVALSAKAKEERVGLVLSGGGAKGLYHVGIIKALEENEIPIDYISGASMGAVVGALYAAGWSPDRMWNFFLTDSVSNWLTGKIPEQYRYYYNQFVPTAEMISAKVNTNQGKPALHLPTNVVSPYLIDLALNDLLTPATAASKGDFDSLMVPFRCVASNMDNRDLITFKEGSLPRAVRSSMTIPMVFKPLSYQDSILLFDGGLLNNYPYQTLETDFEPSIIIGGVCTENTKTPNSDDILGQILTLVTQKTDYNLPQKRDITIARTLDKVVGMLDYGRAEEIMRLGYNDAIAQIDTIRARIARRVSRVEMAKKRAAFVAKQPQLIFDNVQINGLNPAQTGYVRRNLGLHLHNHFTFKYFYERYLKLIGTGVFQGEFPKIEYNPASGYYSIAIQMRTQPSLRFLLGGNLSTHSMNQVYLGTEYQWVGNNVATYSVQGNFGYFYNGVKVGARHDVFTNFPFYVDWGYTYKSLFWDTNNSDSYYRNKHWRLTTESSNGLHSSISIPVLSNSAFRARLEGAISSLSYFEQLHNSQDEPSRSRFSKIGLTAELETNSTNFSMFSTHGVNQLLSVSYRYGREQFTPGSVAQTESSVRNRGWVEARYMREQYVAIGRWFSLGYMVDALFSNHPNWNNWLSTEISLPRFAPTPHMKTLFMTEFSAPSYLAMGVMPVVNFLKNGNFYLKAYAYAFVPQELVFQNREWIAPTAKGLKEYLKYVFGGSLVYQTPVGPVSFTVAKYTTGPRNWNFMLDFGYTIF